jgi:exonuclease SbcC
MLCHNDTKPFKLDYSIHLYKNENIHINWLIHSDDKKNSSYSVTQASGFQKFVISFALRLTMTLFSNKYNNNCSQLFIDEGFVSFDKNNLSIVPIFLKNLLNYYRTVVIVSHIDIIRDNVEEMVSIKNNNNISEIKYGEKL